MNTNKKLLYGTLIVCLLVAVALLFYSSNSWTKEERKPSASNTSSTASFNAELPFGISNPTADNIDQLPEILHGLRLSEENGIAGFVVDTISRKNAEICDDSNCNKVRYDFSEVDTLIDAVVVKGKAHLWIVIDPVTKYQFSDGKIRRDKKTYLPDGPVSRKAFKDYLTAFVNHTSSYGRTKSGNANWHVIRWNLFNEVKSEYQQTFGKERAPNAYAEFALDSAEILRRMSPESEIVLAGCYNNFNIQENGTDAEFYKVIFKRFDDVKSSFSPFDEFDFHWFTPYQSYNKNAAGTNVKDMHTFLARYGYGDKRVIIRAGATYSGQDLDEQKNLTNIFQTESQQAEFLFKRFIYNVGEGVVAIPWSTTVEHKEYQGDAHVIFNFVGLIYNGFPAAGKCDPNRQRPCPDPGNGIKKLAYYTYALLNEKLRGSDFDNIEIIKDGKNDNLYLYKFNKKNNKPIYAAWWDYFNEINFKKGDVKKITLTVSDTNSIKITEAIPKYETGKDVTDYNTAFNTYEQEVVGGKATITLGEKPVYVEEISLSSGSSEWQLIGPGGGGLNNGVYIDPKDYNIAYMPGWPGGIRKTIDGGRTWYVKNSGIDYLKYGKVSEYLADSMNVMAIHPENTNIIFVGAYASNDKDVPGRIYRSTNKGEYWEVVYESDYTIGPFAFDPKNSDIVYACTGLIRGDINKQPKGDRGGSIYKSIKRGEPGSWFKVNEADIGGGKGSANIYSISLRRDNSNIFVSTDNGIYKSTDGGRNWEESNGVTGVGNPGSLPNRDTRTLIIDNTDKGNPDIIYVTVISPPGKRPWRGGVFKTTDGGKTWYPKNNGLGSLVQESKESYLTSNYYDIKMDPSNNLILYTGDVSLTKITGGVYRTLNGGENWEKITNDRNVFLGWHTKDYTDYIAWLISIAPTKPSRVFFIANERVLKSENANGPADEIKWATVRTQEVPPGSNKWQTTGSDRVSAFGIAIDPKNSNRTYLGYGDGGCWKSEDWGETFSKTAGINQDRKGRENVGDINNIIIDSIDPSIFYITSGYHPKHSKTNLLAKAEEYGNKAEVIGGGEEAERGLPNGPQSGFAIDYKDHRWIYVTVFEKGLFRAFQDKPDWQWEDITDHNLLGDSTKVHALTMDPIEPNILYVGINNEGNGSYGKIYKVSDVRGRFKWSQLNIYPSDLGRGINDLKAIVVDERLIFYAATFEGVFKSLDDGKKWESITHGLELREVSRIAINPKNPNIIYAASKFRGLWKSDNAGKVGSWYEVNTNLGCPGNLVGLALDPQKPDIVYTSPKDCGVWRRDFSVLQKQEK